jgi:anti-anti-sigma regulatory factor
MDSSSMGMLLQLREYASDAEPVTLLKPNDVVREILQIANFDKLFTIS